MQFTGFVTLVRQEAFRFWRLIRQTVFPPILMTLLFILIFGFSLGEKISAIHGFSYIVFIIPGLTAMGVMNNAFSNTSTSLYMARFDQSIDNLLAAPLRPVELVSAMVLAAVARGFLIGAITLTVSLSFLHPHIHNLGIVVAQFLLQSVIFGCWGIIGALRAKTWDTLATTQNFIITPMVYLGGVFYSIQFLPPPWKTISLFNPVFYMVDHLRYGILGVHEAPLALSFGISAVCAALLFGICVYLFQIGYRLVR